MKIAVTGGAGFIGVPTLRDAESRGHQVWPFDQEYGHNVLGSLILLDGADAVIHLAGLLGTAELFDDPRRAVEVNVLGATRVMQWCIEHDAKFVSILQPEVFPSVYTATKIAIHKIASALHHSGGLRCDHVRTYNAFGPGQKYGRKHPQKIVPTFAVHAWHRKPIPIWGDGLQGVDMVHVDDVARMLVDVAELPGQNRVFDAGTGTEVTVKMVAVEVAKAAGWDNPQFEHLPMRAGEVPTTNIQAKGEGWDILGWQPPIRRVRETVEWYRNTPLEA